MCEVCVPANGRILSRDRDEAGVALVVLSLCCIPGRCDRIQALPRADDEEGRLLLVHPAFISLIVLSLLSMPTSPCHLFLSKSAFTSLILVFLMLGVHASVL